MNTPLLTAPRAVVFDWDNTLVDSWLCIQESYNRTFRHFGMPEWSLDEVHANVAKSLRDSFPLLFGEQRWEEAREVFYASFEAIHLSHLQPLPGAEALLRGLHARGVVLAVVSNKVGNYLRTEVEALGWGPLFHNLVGATDAEADKPAAAPVHLALAGSGICPGRDVWFLGDALIDMHCAHNSGCQPILIRPRPPRPGEFSSHPPVWHSPCCEAVLGLVSELSIPISPI